MKVTIYKAHDSSKAPLAHCTTSVPVCKGDEFAWDGEPQIVRIARYYVGDDGELALSLWIAPKASTGAMF